jgi:hypothetical protein
MSKAFLQRNTEYKIKGVNYYRTFKYTDRGYYEKGLLYIEPYQDTRITVTAFVTSDDVEVVIEKYNNCGKHLSRTEGIMIRNDVITLLGLD